MRYGSAAVWALALVLASAPAQAAAKKSYTYYRVGNSLDAPAGALQGGTVLMGGGTDVDAAFQWMCGRAGDGDFLVLRTTGTDAYNPYIQQLCPSANSVATLIVPTADGANEAFVADAIRHAEAIWIAGGDQSTYVTSWKGTQLQAEVNAAIGRQAPVGGTSAGMMVLTQCVYSALTSQGVTSSQALSDPFNRYMTLDHDLFTVPFLSGIVGDSHFVTRDRMGRELAFMARIAASGWVSAPRGIAVDEATALLIDAQGRASLAGASAAYFLRAQGAAEVCQPKTPLTYSNVAVHRIVTGQTFNLARWTGSGFSYVVSAVAGALTSTPGGIY